MLFRSINKIDDVTAMTMKHFPFKKEDYSRAMMWCGTIIQREDNASYINSQVVNHERIHLAQAKYKGSWVSFYLSYLWHWFKHNPFARSSYYLNKYEGEAYANDHNYQYMDRYDGSNLNKYDLGRKYWRKYPSVTQYTNFLKTIK